MILCKTENFSGSIAASKTAQDGSTHPGIRAWDGGLRGLYKTRPHKKHPEKNLPVKAVPAARNMSIMTDAGKVLTRKIRGILV